MKLLPFLAALLAFIAATAPARADLAADIELARQFERVIETGDVAGARRLAAAPNFGPLIFRSADDFNVFEEAVFQNKPAIARVIMESASWKKTVWNAKNSARPLVLAARSPEMLPVLKELAKQPNFDLNRPDGLGTSPLDTAAHEDNLAGLKWLVAQPGVNLNRRDKLGQTSLMRASAGATKFLLSLRKMDVNARDNGGMSALHFAVAMGDADKVKVLLAARQIDPNIRDKSRHPSTPLDLAMHNDNVEIARLLMSNRRVRAIPSQRAWLKRKSQPTPSSPSPPDLLPFPGTMTGSND